MPLVLTPAGGYELQSKEAVAVSWIELCAKYTSGNCASEAT